jgi:ribosome-associated translation inhibitor RaiA
LIVKKESNTFEQAIDAASKAVERLLIRSKEKQLLSY